MGSVCFISNQTKTLFYDKIAERLTNKGVTVYWIVVNLKYYKMLVKKYGKNNVLYLPLNISRLSKPFNLKINDLLYSDRRLKNIPDRGIKYLKNIQPYIFDFISTRQVQIVLGEQTYAYECLIFRIVNNFIEGSVAISAYLSRYPALHYCFYSDESFSREIFPSTNKASNYSSRSESIGSDYKKIIKSHISNSKSFAYNFHKFMRFVKITDYDKQDPTWKSNTRWDKLKKNVKNYINIAGYSIIPKVEVSAIKEVPGNSIVFPLHLQPELNIDTAGRYFDNQYEAIINIWRQLGPEDCLFIKEHPVAIGNRGYVFYKKLLSKPNIKILNHQCDVSGILNECDYVFTISGTMGLEAAILGKKVFCMAPTSYDRLSTVATPNIEMFRSSLNIELLYEKCITNKGGWSIDEYKDHMEKFSYPGDAEGDFLGNPSSWDGHNINNVAKVIEGLL